MFIMINFGYKSKRIFTIDCLAAALFDSIWDSCYKELRDIYEAKQIQFAKEILHHQKKLEIEEKKLEALEEKLKEEEGANPDKKKDDKKGAKKGGKDGPALSPLEQEKADLEKSIELSRGAADKYNSKTQKIAELKQKIKDWNEKVGRQQIYPELVDKAGERKFVKTKLSQKANEFLSDRGIYYLCVVRPEGEEQEVEPIVHEGFPLRTVEEDLEVGEEVVFSVKKDDKGKKGGKKK